MVVYLYYRVVVTCYTVQGLQVSYDPFRIGDLRVTLRFHFT
jgi:hypothetical protein